MNYKRNEYEMMKNHDLWQTMSFRLTNILIISIIVYMFKLSCYTNIFPPLQYKTSYTYINDVWMNLVESIIDLSPPKRKLVYVIKRDLF